MKIKNNDFSWTNIILIMAILFFIYFYFYERNKNVHKDLALNNSEHKLQNIFNAREIFEGKLFWQITSFSKVEFEQIIAKKQIKDNFICIF